MAGERITGIITAVVLSVVVAALSALAVYVLLVTVSFFVAMPAAARSGLVVAGLLTVVFSGTLAMALRKTLDNVPPLHRH